MQLQYQIEEGQGYLIAKVTGEWTLDAVQELIDALAEDCRQRNCKKLLADCMDVRVEGRMLEFERFVAGRRVGSKLRHVKLAALFPGHQINKFAESIAIADGADLLVTSDRHEAIRWLMDGSVGEREAGL